MAESVVKCCYNGAEYSFVTKDPAQIEDLKCPICLELVYEPVLTTCGHQFCQKCVRGQARCPTCRGALQYFRNQRDERRVKTLKVKCPNWEKGCEWQGDLVDTTQHTGTNCQMETIACPKGCAEKIARRHLTKHDAFCMFRAHKCPYCRFEDTFINIITIHFATCEDFKLLCPAGCNAPLLRFKIVEHLAGCAEEFVPCKYAAIGCEEEIRRKDLQTHLQDKKDYHLERSMEMVVQLSMGLSEVSLSMKSMASEEANYNPSRLPLPFRPWLQNTPTCYPRPPWIIKIVNFEEKKASDEVWFSDPVYSHFGGYKMCLKVYTNGNSDAKGTHVSVYICLMRGDNDDNLKWPFKGTVRVSLLNQLEDRQHYTGDPWSPDDDITGNASVRVIGKELSAYGFGCSKFISFDYKGTMYCHYLIGNTLFFRVDYIEPDLDF